MFFFIVEEDEKKVAKTARKTLCILTF